MQEILGVRSFVLITGASRGFGRALAVELGKVVGTGSTLLLLARNKEQLEETKAMAREVRPGLAVEVQPMDLSTADKEAFEKAILAHRGSADHPYEVAIVIHNAGTLGQDGRKITDMTNMEEMQDYYRLNLFHVICLNSVFTTCFPKSRMSYINISSILALQPLTTWANYCGGKAARDAVFRVLAVEQPQAVVLNYAPGPLDTPMIEDLLGDVNTHQGSATSSQAITLTTTTKRSRRPEETEEVAVPLPPHLLQRAQLLSLLLSDHITWSASGDDLGVNFIRMIIANLFSDW